MSENIDLTNNNDSLEQELPSVFIKLEELNEKKERIDYSKVYILPSIKTRYFSTLIDIIVITLLSLGISALFEKMGQVPDYVRGVLFVGVFILYEPVLISVGSTIGQLLLNIRVRKFKNPEKKLAFPSVFLRFVIKVLFGWLSFITVTFNINRLAIHDYACGSIMIANKIEE
jgi:hypothetical protein